MKTLYKIAFYTNITVAGLLLLGYLVPYLPPKHIGYLSLLALLMPSLLLLNILFAIYWMIRWKALAFISAGTLLLGFGYVGLWVQPWGKEADTSKSFKLLSFNVRLFNHYHWHRDAELSQKISDFFTQEAPDLIVLQEYYNSPDYVPQGYRYKAVVLRKAKDKIGLALFSKHKLLRWGSLQFENTTNNGMYADVLIGKDTIRVYNLHLESFHVSTKEDDLFTEDKQQLVENITQRFERQQEQVARFVAHQSECRYPIIVCGDFNNTAYSYIYRKLRGNRLNDAFQEAGKGFGRTFEFKYFPMRIDFILPDKRLEVNNFKTHYLELSDHFPLTANLQMAE